MIDVARDTEGVRMALEELFEEEHARARIGKNAENASPETQERLERTIPARTLSPGYYRWADHLLLLETEHKLGVAFNAHTLAAAEAAGLIALDRARRAFERRHPPCSACGALQDSAFGPKCVACGTKFARKG